LVDAERVCDRLFCSPAAGFAVRHVRIARTSLAATGSLEDIFLASPKTYLAIAPLWPLLAKELREITSVGRCDDVAALCPQVATAFFKLFHFTGEASTGRSISSPGKQPITADGILCLTLGSFYVAVSAVSVRRIRALGQKGNRALRLLVQLPIVHRRS